MGPEGRPGSIRDRLRENPLGSRLGRRFLGWLLLFSLVPLFGSNMLGYLESQGILERLARRHVAALAQTQALHVRDRVDGLLHDLELVAGGNRFLAAGAIRLSGGDGGEMGAVADRGAIERHLRNKLAGLPSYEAIFLERLDGGVAAATGDAGDPADWAGGVGMPVRVSEVADASAPPPLYFSVPLEGPDGAPVGRLGGVTKPNALADLLVVPPHLAGTIESFVLDAEGRPLFISHPHGHPEYGHPLETPLLAAEPGTLMQYTDREGAEVIGTSLSVPGLSWRYVAEFPVSAVLGPLRRLRRASLLFGAVFGVVLVIGAWFVTGGIVAPVRRLVKAARRVGGGDLDVRVSPETNNEIGELARAFNEMTGKLASARSRLEELHRRDLERAQQLATVGELASGVAHEIKNPVVGISNGLDLVRRRIGGDEVVQPILDEMSQQAFRIHAAVRDLLTFARPPEPDPAPLRVNRIVERALRLVQPAADGARVHMEFRPAPDVPELWADAELLRQAVVNLAMNAVQATPAGGNVTLATAHRKTDGEVTIEVVDDGVGISPELREEIFKPFFTTRHNGSGLGLAITVDLVRRQGGRLELESRVGTGSTFRILFPTGSASRPRRSAGGDASDAGVAAGGSPGTPEEVR